LKAKGILDCARVKSALPFHIRENLTGQGFGKSRGQTRMASKTALNCWSYFFSDAASLFTSAFQLTYLDSAAKRVNYQKSIT